MPAAYDDAMRACAGYLNANDKGSSTSADPNLASAASVAALQTGPLLFCASVGNVRSSAPTATFGQFVATATPSVTAAPTASPTGAAGHLGKTERALWAVIVAGAVVAAIAVVG